MMTKPIYLTIAALGGMLALAQAGPKDDLLAAVKKLSEAESYAWKTTSGSPNSDRGARESHGKTTKDGLIYYSMTFRDNETVLVKKGDKGAVKGEDGWRSLAELESARNNEGGGGGDRRRGRGGFITRMMRNVESPAAKADEIIENLESVEVTDGVYSAAMTEDAVKELYNFGRRRRGGDAGGGGPEISDASGSVKFWVKDGVLSKYETKTSASMSFNGQDRKFDRTTSVEVSGVGETKIEVPEGAKAKLEG